MCKSPRGKAYLFLPISTRDSTCQESAPVSRFLAERSFEAARALPNLAPAGKPSAADMGITPGKLDTLETRIETYNLVLGSPRAVRGEISTATRGIETAFAEADELAKDGLDKLMLQFRGTDFFSEYQSTRKIARRN